MALDELCDGEGADLAEIRVAEFEVLEALIARLEDVAKGLGAEAVQVAVSHVQILNLCIALEDRHQNHEI